MIADKKMFFKLFKITPVIAAFGLLLTAGMTASAQQTTQPAKPQPPKLIDKGKHGDWTIRCTEKALQQTQQTPPAATDETGKSDQATTPAQKIAPPQCVMIQIARHPEQQNFGISVLVVKQTVQGKAVSQMRITVPIGVYLPAGVGVEIDGTAIGRLGYELCSPQGVCVATTFLNEELLGKFKAGGAAKFYIKDIRGRDSVFDLSLKGYTAAYDSL